MRIKLWTLTWITLICLMMLASVPTDARQTSGPTDSLSYIPSGSLFFVHLEGKALWNSSLFDELQKRVPPSKWKRFEEGIFKESEKITGIVRQNFRSATIVLDSWEIPQVPSFALLITSSVPIDRAKFVNSIRIYAGKFGQGGGEAEAINHQGVELTPVRATPGQTLYAGLLRENIGVVGDVETLKKAINQQKDASATGPLSRAIKAARGHDIALGISLPENMRTQLEAVFQLGLAARGESSKDIMNMMVGIEMLKTLIDLKQAQLQLDIERDIVLRLAIDAASERAAIRYQRLIDMFAFMGEFGLQHLQGISQMKTYSELREFSKFFTLLADATANSKVVRSGTTVDWNLNAPAAGRELVLAASSAFTRIVLLQDRMDRQANLRTLAIAMHNYHSDYKRLPSPGTYQGGSVNPQPGSEDKPFLSWRVALLPYLGHDNIYKQFHVNEPWDSPHNKKFIAMMPKVYASPGAPDAGEGKTHVQVFVAPAKPGKDSKQKFIPIFQWGKPGATLGQITVQDGTSNTMMIAEGANAVVWTKPDDMLITDDEAPLPKLGCVPDEDDFFVVFADASVRTIRRAIPDMKLYNQLLRQMIGRRDGMNDDVAPIMK